MYAEAGEVNPCTEKVLAETSCIDLSINPP